MEPKDHLQSDMDQDQSGEHFPLRSSEGAGQGSFKQQCDRCEIFFSLSQASLPASVSILTNIVSNAGHFLYVTIPDAGLSTDWASFQSHPLEPTSSTHPCKVSHPLYNIYFITNQNQI